MNCVGGPIGEELIAPLVMSFQASYPNVEVELDFSKHRVDLIEDSYDLVLRVGEMPDSTLIARRPHHTPHTLCRKSRFPGTTPEHPRPRRS